MASFLSLVVVCIAMFCGSFFAGHLPLSFTLSERTLHHTSVFGAGLIVGTALVVILPEGCETLYSALNPHSHKTLLRSPPTNDHHPPKLDRTIGSSLLAGFVTMFIIEQLQARTVHVPRNSPNATRHLHDRSLATVDPDIIDVDDIEYESPPTAIRLHPQTSPTSRNILLSDISMTARHPPHRPSDPSYSSVEGQSVMAATIGLVIHSFSDGVAMGAAAVTSQPALETAIFLAILLHKAPSAFGLTTYLLHHGTVSTHRIRSHLLAFSLAAPLAACTTFLALRGAGGSPQSIAMWTGILLLFSAGSFLYVATVHILPEVIARRGGHLCASQVSFMLLGMLLPLVIQVDHDH